MKLKDLIPLKSKITVYVPATVDINKENRQYSAG